MLATKLIAVILAVSSNGNQYTPTFPIGGIIAWLVCSRRKREAMGGWLLFYYWQLYGGILVTVAFVAIAFQSYVPESFDDPTKYHLFLLSVVPSLVIAGIEIAIATILISVPTWDMLKLLRMVMIAGLIFAACGTVIDVFYFPDNLGFDALTIIPACLWLTYFFRSRRVIHIFKTHDWEIAVNNIHPQPGLVPKAG